VRIDQRQPAASFLSQAAFDFAERLVTAATRCDNACDGWEVAAVYLLSRNSIPLAVSSERDVLRHCEVMVNPGAWTPIGDDHEVSEQGFEIFPIPQF
jgi:hypothetical protein